MDAPVKEVKLFKGFSIFSSGGHLVQWSESLSNFGRQSPKEYSCEIISKSVHPFSRRSRQKHISFYSPGGHFVQRIGIV